MKNFKILTSYTNKAEGIQSFVSTNNGKDFFVSLKDTDANEFVGMAEVYSDQKIAEAYAFKCVDVDAPVTGYILV